MKTTKKLIILSLVILMTLLTGCQPKEPDNTLKTPELPLEHEQEFGGIYLKMTIDEFNALGFKYGDSVNITFSNGFVMEDIPYYNGYYVDAGSPLLIAYPGYDYIKAAINYGEDLWERAGLDNLMASETLWLKAALDENSTGTVSLNETGKYLDVQQARDISYSDDRSQFDSDVIFANFRNFALGNMKEGRFYRSASPCDNQHKRAPYVDALMKENGVNAILNLSDNKDKIIRYIDADDFSSVYFLTLYETGNVIPIALNMNYLSEEFAVKIAQGLIELTEKQTPYLVHCTEGKDRTGFVCMLIEMLAGAEYQEIADDYMVTYDNYYKITQEKDPARYKTILEKNLEAMMQFVINDATVDFKTAELSGYARHYLIQAGMSDAQIDAFLHKICD
ncbi:MAG: tyrosine-protein phosphatase [Erysipelotrichaceae bacterium]|nr:tyrosine-protein phosphatase [Erysipelotrichaceae bacterium]